MSDGGKTEVCEIPTKCSLTELNEHTDSFVTLCRFRPIALMSKSAYSSQRLNNVCYRALLHASRVLDCMASIVAFVNAASMALMIANATAWTTTQGTQGIQSTVAIFQVLVLCGEFRVLLFVTGACHFTQA